MESQENAGNVVSIFGAKPKQTDERKKLTVEEAELIFNDAMKRNEENRKRMIKNRLNDNKSVLKSYRIKKP